MISAFDDTRFYRFLNDENVANLIYFSMDGKQCYYGVFFPSLFLSSYWSCSSTQLQFPVDIIISCWCVFWCLSTLEHKMRIFTTIEKKKEKEMCVGDDLYASVCVPSDPKQHIIIAIASPHNFLSCEYRIFDFWYTYTCMRLRWWLHVGFSLHKLCRCVFKLHVVYMTMTPKTR